MSTMHLMCDPFCCGQNAFTEGCRLFVLIFLFVRKITPYFVHNGENCRLSSMYFGNRKLHLKRGVSSYGLG